MHYHYFLAMAIDHVIREARVAARLTQAELAARLGTTQSAVARLERSGSNPRIATVSRALAACGRSLVLDAEVDSSNVDPTLVARQLRLGPGERLRAFERVYADARELALAGRRARGELA
jgi:transcriptional regulator with XRE-family HTH domain